MTRGARFLLTAVLLSLIGANMPTPGFPAEPPPEPEAVAQAARSLLAEAVRSDYEATRMMALRAAASVPDRAIADAARPMALSNDRYESSLALDVLAVADPTGSRAEFLAALDSPHRTVRLRGLRALAGVRDPALAARFARVLGSDPDPDLRALAARALGATGAEEIRPPLYAALDDSSEAVRREVVKALAALADGVLPAELERRLAQVPPGQRVGIITLIALVPEPRLVTTLAPYLGDPSEEVRLAAAAAILSIPSPDPVRR